jgi:hypothetical protein
MALKKQSIRAGMNITLDGELISKEELIEISESWTANQEIFFRKMLQQGGQFSVQGRKYTVESRTKDNLDSNGNPPRTVPLMPGERTF